MEAKHDAIGQQSVEGGEEGEKSGENATYQQTHLVEVHTIDSWVISNSTEHNLAHCLRHCHVTH